MGEKTEIAWTDATYNPWVGCQRVSEACANCYMFRDAKRYGNDPSVIRRTGTSTFNAPLKWSRNRDKYGHINRVFTCSWSDFFIEEADAWRPEAWAIIQHTPNLIYQILTKRPERIEKCLPETWMVDFNHVWLGITAETQRRFSERSLDIYAAASSVPFISAEPMLGPLNLMPYMSWLKWVICGCESGPNARETKIEWVRDLRDQCISVNIPFFLKQLVIDGKLVTTPELDGQRWTQFPEVDDAH